MADAWELRDLLARLRDDRHDVAEVFRSPSESLSLTIVRWPAGSIDDQRPHAEDEVYHVTAGRGVLTIGSETVPVTQGTTAFVAAGVEHRFSEISEDLDVLVFWSPARARRAG